VVVGRRDDTATFLGRAEFVIARANLEQALLVVHIGVVAQLARGLLEVRDALGALAERLVAARQVVLRDDGELDA